MKADLNVWQLHALKLLYASLCRRLRAAIYCRWLSMWRNSSLPSGNYLLQKPETTRRYDWRAIDKKKLLSPGESFTFFFVLLFSFDPKLKVADIEQKKNWVYSDLLRFTFNFLCCPCCPIHETKDKRDTMKWKKEKICLVKRVNLERGRGWIRNVNILLMAFN